MKKGVRILCVVIVLGIAFVFGWRVMPKVWPGIKRNIVCSILPQTRPEPETEGEPELYTPKSSSLYGDEISETDSLIYYFYKDYCPYCMALEPLMAAPVDSAAEEVAATARLLLAAAALALATAVTSTKLRAPILPVRQAAERAAAELRLAAPSSLGITLISQLPSVKTVIEGSKTAR